MVAIVDNTPGAFARRTFSAGERTGLRAAAWLDLPVALLAPPYDRTGRRPRAGLRLAPFTPARENILQLAGSPLVTGGGFTRFQLVQALYVCSPAFRAGSFAALARFLCRWWFVPFARTHAALRLWYAAQYLDEPPREVTGRTAPSPGTYGFAGFVLTCKFRLRLSEAEVLGSPVPRLLQQLSALESSRGGDAPHFDPERARQAGEYLRAKAARQTASP